MTQTYDSEAPAKEKTLNVMFQFNGHSWDAFEVLGIPAGSSLEKAKEAFEQNLKAVEPESRELLEMAFSAIRAHIEGKQ